MPNFGKKPSNAVDCRRLMVWSHYAYGVEGYSGGNAVGYVSGDGGFYRWPVEADYP